MKYSSIVMMAIIMLLSLGLGYNIGKCHEQRQSVPPTVDTISIVTVDTVVIDRPVLVNHYIYKVDTLVASDTLMRHDTIYTLLPRERQVYSDTLFRAVISGVRPSLDSISIYGRTKTINSVVTLRTTPKWGLGLQLGLTYNNRVTPYIGLGLQYNFLTW